METVEAEQAVVILKRVFAGCVGGDDDVQLEAEREVVFESFRESRSDTCTQHERKSVQPEDMYTLSSLFNVQQT